MQKQLYAEELRESMRIMVRKSGALEKGEASCCGITIAQCHALIEIGRSGDISLNDLADKLYLDKSTLSRTINNLVETEAIERAVNPDDRRYIVIKLTEKGLRMYEDIEQSMNMYYRNILEAIPVDKHGQVIESLHLLTKAMDKRRCC